MNYNDKNTEYNSRCGFNLYFYLPICLEDTITVKLLFEYSPYSPS